MAFNVLLNFGNQMKKSIFAATLASLLISSVNVAHASDGNINFIGEIKDSTCTIGDGLGNDLDIYLGTPSVASFKSVASTSSAARFDISLTDCPASVPSVSVAFGGIADINTTEILKINEGPSAATGVGIRIEEADGTQIILNKTDNLVDHPVESDMSVTMNYVAKYESTLSSVTPGDANATAQFTIMYN